MKVSLRNFALLLLLCVFVAACTTHYGWVVDKNGQPVDSAKVTINSKSIKTKTDGSFRLKTRKGAIYRLGIQHASYADLFFESRDPLKDDVWTLATAKVVTVDPTNPITLVDDRPEANDGLRAGAVFELPPNALVDANGNPPSGMLQAAIATLNLENSEGPGSWGTVRADGREGFLVSYGAVYIQFSDASGKEYQIRSGMTGNLSLPVEPSMLAHTGATPNAPFWYFDEEDQLWYEGGSATYDAVSGAYRGTVNHLSTINTDIAKFDNAACLAITLDSSVPTGNTLRIRYHSGGTAFGQVPQFVMNDTLNAAYRLPANTNVLLEMLNPGGDVLSNLVVEDPAGNPLVNTVVNTGPQIPPGNSLWPPAPYTDCKPITVVLGDPEVEIRINATTAAPGVRDNPSDDYLTWAPTFALARLSTPMMSDVNVVLTNDNPNIGGNVRFAAHQNPWPVDTTATSTTLALTLPADGSWVPFVVAGEYNTPSINDKDAIIEVHQNTAMGAVLSTKALMVRVRKDANTLTQSEVDRLLFAFQKFRHKVGGLNYVLVQEMHRLASSAGDEAHMQPAFLTWHRAFLLLVERELQALEPSVALHYWNWDAASPNFFTEAFIGETSPAGGGVVEPEFTLTNPLLGWDTNLPFNSGELRRNDSDHSVDPAGAMKFLDHPVDPSLIDWTDYGPRTNSFTIENSFADDVENESHNEGHGWPCGGGHLFFPSRSAADPLFFFLHSQIDREWAYFQQVHNRDGQVVGGVLTFPAPQHYDNNGAYNSPGAVTQWDFRQQGSFLEDGMWPWDGTSGGAPMSVELRPVNQATSGGTNVPLSMPLIPSTPFPESEVENLWPPVDTVPLNRHMIDYHGKFDPVDGLGFSYDDVPY